MLCAVLQARPWGGSGDWRPDGLQPRIIRDMNCMVTDTLHYAEAAESECGRIILAHDDLPVSGTHGKNLLGFVSELRARALPYDAIGGVINALAAGT